MLLSIVYPIVDSRPFLQTEELLRPPMWPIPEPDADFVRNFGIVRSRPLGGLHGWVGESEICDARKAIRFNGLPACRYSRQSNPISLRPAYRRFYSDGLAVSKLEIGIAANIRRLSLSQSASRKLLNHLLQTEVILPNPIGRKSLGHLASLRRRLADLYSLSTVPTHTSLHPEPWWVKVCKPIVLIVQPWNEEFHLPFREALISSSFADGNRIVLSYCRIPYGASTLPLWKISLVQHSPRPAARQLRISLLRLNVEQVCLRQILENLDTGKIKVQPRSRSSNRLQSYLLRALRTITWDRRGIVGSQESSATEAALSSMDAIAPGRRESLLEVIDRIDIRENLRKRLQAYLDAPPQIYIERYIERQYMRDQYVVSGQAGAVGPHSHAHDIDFAQLWSKAEGTLDLQTLADELEALRTALKRKTPSPDHDADIGRVAQAETEARKGNGPKVLEYLSKTGAWALQVAREIGVKVAAEVLKSVITGTP